MNHLHTRNSYAKSFDVKARNSRSLGLINPVARKYTIPQLMELGNNFHKTGNVELAESAFRKVLELVPQIAITRLLQFGDTEHPTVCLCAAHATFLSLPSPLSRAI